MQRELLQNAQKFCYEMRVVSKCAEILLRNARCYKMRRNFVTKCARCYIMRRCYKMRLNRPSCCTRHTKVQGFSSIVVSARSLIQLHVLQRIFLIPNQGWDGYQDPNQKYGYLLLNTRRERVGYGVSCGTCQPQKHD